MTRSPSVQNVRDLPRTDLPARAKLPRSRALALANELGLSAMSDDLPVSAHHKRLLTRRWADFKAGRTKAISRAELEQRLRVSR